MPPHAMPSPAWNPQPSHLRAVPCDVQTGARIGLHPWEQHAERPTRPIVNVGMFAPLADGLHAETPGVIVDYDGLRDALRAWPARPHTPLLDELAGLCVREPHVAACRAGVMKPGIFNEAAAAGVAVSMLREDHRA